MTPSRLVALDRAHVWHPFTQEATAPDPIPISSAKGISLFTEEGEEILDLISSWWVNIHGHAHPKVAGAIAAQAHKLEHVIFAGFTHAPAVEITARLAAVLPGGLERGFFSDNGSTAVEVAMKLAIQYWRNKGEPERTRFLSMQGGYHGDTFGAMSAGVGSGFFTPFEDLFFAVDTLPYPETFIGDAKVEAKEADCLAALDRHLNDQAAHTAALVIEPLVQGAGGMRMLRAPFLRQLVTKIRDAGILVIFDEVMTGFGRTGGLFASLTAEVTPDLICLSKGLTAGYLPMSMTFCTDDIYQSFLSDSFDTAFLHGHSFTANPLGCAAALASLDLLTDPQCAKNRAMIEAGHRKALEALADDFPELARPRLRGTIGAIDYTGAGSGYGAAVGAHLKSFFWNNGVLIRPLGNVIYIMPPYCITEEQLALGWEKVVQACRALKRDL